MKKNTKFDGFNSFAYLVFLHNRWHFYCIKMMIKSVQICFKYKLIFIKSPKWKITICQPLSEIHEVAIQRAIISIRSCSRIIYESPLDHIVHLALLTAIVHVKQLQLYRWLIQCTLHASQSEQTCALHCYCCCCCCFCCCWRDDLSTFNLVRCRT